LFAQEKIFGCNCSSGLETEMGERKRIQENTEQSPNKVQEQSHDSILLSH